MLGRELEALHILALLGEYAVRYHRTYLQIELLTLRAIILYRRGEDWQEDLLTAVQMAQPHKLIRIFADQGTALLPLWQAAMQTQILPATDYTTTVKKELKRMAAAYPGYLKPPRRFEVLTEKEMVVLRLMALGRNNTQIAQELEISLGTAKFHVKNIMQKLSAENRTVAVKVAQEEGLL